MAPILKPRQSLVKDRFANYFGSMKTQAYHTPSTQTIRTIAWNATGSLIAVGATDKSLRVWNPEKPNARYSTDLKGHAAPIEKIAFNPVKESELCSVSNDGVVKFWDVRNKTCINEVKGLGEAFTVVWAPDGESLIVGNKTDNIFILDPTASTPRASFQQPVQTNQISFSWDGSTVFITTGEGKVRILTYPDFRPAVSYDYDIPGAASREFALAGHTSSCLSVELSPVAKYLATGGSDSIIALWDTADLLCQRTLTTMSGPVRSLSFTWDGMYLVGGSDEGTGVEVYYVETGEPVHTFKTASPCPVVAWHPTRYFLAFMDAGTLRIVGLDADRK